MLPEIGLFSLILAGCFALLQAVIGIAGIVADALPHARCLAVQKSGWSSAQCKLVWMQFSCVLLSIVILSIAFISNDFSVAYVAQNSNSTLPLIYRFCALWGGHEGSMLLWVFILSVWTTGIVIFAGDIPSETISRVLVVMGLIAVGFYLFILGTSNPFLRLLPNVPINGRDLNPLLQDPGLVSHPPILYLGYVGLSVPFSFAIAALWQGRFDASWARWMRSWTTLSWCFLTLGIMLGSWWAYRELGWGGWWFWDPVENASFLPWLVATALLHSLMVTEKRQQFKSWTVLLAICAFSLSLIGTFLVRSGVLISVHSFAVDPSRGTFILVFLLLVISLSLLLYAWRSRRLSSPIAFSLYSRESFLLANNILLFVIMLTVLLGTLYPLVVELLQWGKISVGAPYFTSVFVPLFIPVVLLMGIAPSVPWITPKAILWLLLLAFLLATAMVVFFWHSHYVTIIGLLLACWLVLTTVYHRWRCGFTWRSLAVTFAHLGMAVTIIGVVLAYSYSDERDLRLRVGEVANLGNYSFTLLQLNNVVGTNYRATRADVLLKHNNNIIKTLRPEYRFYLVSKTDLSKTDIAVSWWRDLYVALGSPYQDGSWSMRIYFKPFVRWIWIGGLMMVLGGLMAVFVRKKRVS